MLKFFSIIIVGLVFATAALAEEVVGSDYRDGMIQSVGQAPLVNVPIPVPRPPGISAPVPRKEEPRWQGGQSRADFSRISRSMTNEPIWPKFAALFNRCAPGCAPNVVSLRASRSGRSCHPSGNAIDISSIKCGGVVSRAGSSASSARFNEFVKCTRGQKHGTRKWTVLYKETHQMRSRDCRNWRNMITTCHWDHVHLDVGC